MHKTRKTVESFGPLDAVVWLTDDLLWRWWWKDILLVGVSGSCGIHVYLGPLGHFHYWS